jgi:hypothetical protein
MLDPDMPTQELRLHMGELTPDEVRVARAAIRWANTAMGWRSIYITTPKHLQEVFTRTHYDCVGVLIWNEDEKRFMDFEDEYTHAHIVEWMPIPD